MKLHQCPPNGEVHITTSVTIAIKPDIGITLEPGKRYASLDGDADRVVFFYEDNGVLSHQYGIIAVMITCREVSIVRWRQNINLSKNYMFTTKC